MKLFKFTEQDNTTYKHSTLWGENITHSKLIKENPNLCSTDVLHAYSNRHIAYLLNPIHANISEPILWQAEGKIVVKDFGKVGCFSLTTIKKINKPKWVDSPKDLQVRVMFAVLCAEAVLRFYEDKYPTDKRVLLAIEAAKEYARNPSQRAAYAAYAAYAAAYAAYAAYAAEAAYAAAYAARAADAAARAAADINFTKLANTAVKLIMNVVPAGTVDFIKSN